MEKPEVKHLTMTCPRVKCEAKAFVQVLVVEETELQPKIDERANKKLKDALIKAHREGQHGR